MKPGLARAFPSSLFARTVLVVVGGLIVAQSLSVLLLFDERSRWFLQGRITRSSHRIADAVRVVEAQRPEIRAEVAAGFVDPAFRIEVRAAEPALPASDPALIEPAGILAADLLRELPPRARSEVSARFDPEPRPAQPAPCLFRSLIPATRIEARVASADGAHWYHVIYRLPADARGLPDRLLRDIALQLGVLLLLLLVAVRWVTRPLSVLATAADRLGRNLDEPPIPERGPGEVRRAAQAFNRMQQRLRELLAQKAHMLAAVSHDLKTPITRLRLRAEMLTESEPRARIARDLDEMEAMVGATLELMRGSTDVEPLVRTDLLALVESLQADYEDTGRAVSLVESGPVTPIELRPRAIRRCLANLIDNGLNYGGRVRLRIVDAPDVLRIEIDDDGPGIPEADLARVFEPFYRVEGSRNRESGGTGLGLAIARSIALEHAGDLVLENRAEGGLRASLLLPRH